MNTLKKAEKYIRRPVIADLVGTNRTYLSVLAKDKLTPDMERRVKQAIKYVIKELKSIL